MGTSIAFITGASSGLGFRLATDLTKLGYQVLATGRNPEGLQQLAQQSPPIKTAVANLAKSDQINNLLAWLKDQAPDGVDIFIHCAGQAHLGASVNIPRSAVEEALQVQVLALHEIVKMQIPHWQRRRSGRLIVISSGVAYRGLPEVSTYCLAKAAQLSLSQSLAVELAPYDIQVITVSPGLMEGAFQQKALKYGSLSLDFSVGAKVSLETAAQRIIATLQSQSKHFDYSGRGLLMRILNGLCPNLTHLLLRRQYLKRSST